MAFMHFAPYVPGTDGPWDARTAAHLLRRAGFGAPREEVQKAVARGLEATVDALFDDAADEEARFQETFERISGSLVNFAEPIHAQAWWVYRMVRSDAPLREKLTLFWHGHFATSFHKVENMALMLRQNETLRQHAWSNFRDLVLAIARDPAMLVFLDGQTNTKEHPNENFARELMELFTCGIGNYSERDVQEAARAFTGWHREGAEFVFNGERHDSGRKEFLGKSGRFDGTDVIDILMQHPSTPRFIARKLIRYFAAPEPSEDVVAEAAALFDRAQLNVKWLLRELFLSKYFYSEACYRKRISSPAEFVIGTARTLGARLQAPELAENMSAMGQQLFGPPNVKGWDGEQKWIHSTALAARTNFARRLSELNSESELGPRLELDHIVPGDVTEPAKVVDALAALLLDGELADDARHELAEFLVRTDEGRRPQLFREEPAFRRDRIRATLGMLLSLPEYQTC